MEHLGRVLEQPDLPHIYVSPEAVRKWNLIIKISEKGVVGSWRETLDQVKSCLCVCGTSSIIKVGTSD